MTSVGSTVIITDGKSKKAAFSTHPGLLLTEIADAGDESDLESNRRELAQGFRWRPERSPEGPVSITVSWADGQAYVYRNAVEIGRASVSITNPGRLIGSHCFSALDRFDGKGRREWLASGSVGGPTPNVKALADIAPEFFAAVKALIEPGTTLILTDLPPSAAPPKANQASAS